MRTTYKSDRILNTYRATNDTAPATEYAGLLTAVTAARAGTVTEASWAGYARKPVTFGAPGAVSAGRQISNTAAVLFDAKGDVGSVDVIAIGIYDAVSGGNLTDIIYQDAADPLAASVDTGEVTSNTLDSPAHGLANDQRVRVQAFPGSPTLPTGFSEDTTYWVVGSATDSFQLSLTQGGAAIDITSTGRAIVHRLTPKTITQGIQAYFDVASLKLTDG